MEVAKSWEKEDEEEERRKMSKQDASCPLQEPMQNASVQIMIRAVTPTVSDECSDCEMIDVESSDSQDELGWLKERKRIEEIESHEAERKHKEAKEKEEAIQQTERAEKKKQNEKAAAKRRIHIAQEAQEARRHMFANMFQSWLKLVCKHTLYTYIYICIYIYSCIDICMYVSI